MKNRLYELNENEYNLITEIAQSTYKILPPMITSIINGNMKGTVYVNDKDNMELAIVLTNFDWIFVVGNSENEKTIELLCTLMNQKIESDAQQIAVFGVSQENAEIIKSNLQIELRAISKIRYKFNLKEYENKMQNLSINPSIKIKRINISNVDEVMRHIDGIKMFWNTSKHFLEKSFGYVLYIDSEIASVCFANNVCGFLREIDIFTNENYRGENYAVYTCSTFIEHCIKNNFMPHWETVNLNKSSLRLAEKLGFERDYEYPMHVCFNQSK